MNTIPFRIFGMEVPRFIINQNTPNEGEKIEIATQYEFGIDTNNHVVSCRTHYEYRQSDISLMQMTLVCIFNIEENAFVSFISNDNTFVLPKGFAQYLATINVGAARGEIHARCCIEHSPLQNVVLPPINLVEALSEDINIRLVKEPQ